MTDTFRALIGKAATGAALTREEAANAFEQMMSGEATPSQMGGFLMALRVRGETVDEITGAVSDHARQSCCALTAPPDAIDVVGTGGDASGSVQHLHLRAPSSSPAPACRWPSTATAPCRRDRAPPTC